MTSLIHFPALLLCWFIILNKCHGFEFSMERKNLSLKGKSYCGLLRCQVDTVTEDNVSSLIKIDIYYLNNRTLLSTISAKDSEIQANNGNTATIIGSMSEHHGELRLYLNVTADCLEANFICRINFVHASGQTDISEKATLSTVHERGGTDLFMKSQISFEQSISDQSGLFLKNLISPKDLLKDRMAFSFQMGNSAQASIDQSTGQPLNSLVSTKTTQEPDINQTLRGLESRLVSMFNLSMTEMLVKIKNIFENEKKTNQTANEMQAIENIVQRSNEAQFLKLDAKLNELMNKTEGCISRKILTQVNDGHVNISQIQRSLDSISEKLDDLLTSQKTQKEILANFSCTSATLNLQEIQPKCERGMSSSKSPREVMSIYNNSQILCDTQTDGGGWIIIQRRIKGDTSFNVSWDSYKNGFGSLQGDFWLGNDVISNLTRTEDYILRIDMTCGNVVQHAIYNYFKVENETQLYTLRLGEFYGNATDQLSYNSNQPFTTLDRDNDKFETNCANHEDHHSGWWHKHCSLVNLNGAWWSDSYDRVYWDSLKTCSIVEMKIRKK